MTAPISDIVVVNIVAQVANISQQGFGTGLIISYEGSFTGVRKYSSAADVAADFAVGTVTNDRATAYFSQSPAPTALKIYAAPSSSKPTQQFEFTPTVLNSTLYSFQAQAQGGAVKQVLYTSDGTATAAEITAGLKTAFDLFSLAMTSSQQNTNTVLRLLANAAGVHFKVAPLKADGTIDPNMTVAQNHADVAIATDLAQALLIDADFYSIITLFNSKAVVDAAAAWAEGAARLYVADNIDTAVTDTPKSGTDDVGESTQANSYTHTSVWHTPSTGDSLGAGVEGKCLPFDPGVETWAYKKIAGVTVANYTPTQRSNMEAKNVNWFEPIANLNVTRTGICASGDFIDFIRFIDFLKARLGEAVFTLLVTLPKIPFNDVGFTAVEAKIRSVFRTAEEAGKLNPGWTVTMPTLASINSADKAARILRGVNCSAVFSGAIHTFQLNVALSV
jgi:hypothetical protein